MGKVVSRSISFLKQFFFLQSMNTCYLIEENLNLFGTLTRNSFL